MLPEETLQIQDYCERLAMNSKRKNSEWTTYSIQYYIVCNLKYDELRYGVITGGIFTLICICIAWKFR